MEIINADKDGVEFPRVYYSFVSRLHSLYDSRYCRYKTVIYELHTAAKFPFSNGCFSPQMCLDNLHFLFP